MLLKHTLLYLPAQIIGPLMQLVAMVVWTHLVNDHTLGIITLVIATHELLQIGFLAWWSQFALRFFGRFQAPKMRAFLPDRKRSVVGLRRRPGRDRRRHPARRRRARRGMAVDRGHRRLCRDPDASLYISERARASGQIGIYSVQQIFGPAAGFAAGWILIVLRAVG